MSLTSVVATDALVPLFVDTLTTTLENGIESAIRQLPRVLGGLFVLLVGVVLGAQMEPIVVRLCRRVGVDRHFEGTPVETLIGESPGAASRAVGTAVKYYVILFSALIAVNVTEFQELSTWLETLVVWVPRALAGVAVILIGLVLTEYAVRRTRAATVVAESEYGPWIPASVRAILYLIVFTIGLDMIGINLEIVYLIVEGITSAIGLGIVVALALALGLAAGVLAKDYVDRQLDERVEAAED